jgi:hypothetical protein
VEAAVEEAVEVVVVGAEEEEVVLHLNRPISLTKSPRRKTSSI